MTLFYSFDEQTIIVSGQTFPHKERIKALGGRFFSSDKTWRLPFEQEVLDKVEILCSELGGGLAGATVIDHGKKELALSSEAIEIHEEHNTNLALAGYSISQLMGRVGQCLAREFSEPVWVIGEVQNLQIRKQAVFLNLAEGAAAKSASQATMTASGIIWRSAWKALEVKFASKLEDCISDGMQLRCLCQIGFYQGRGSLTLSIIDIDIQFLKGALALAREKLLSELRALGLDQANKKLKFPRLPLRVGLLSSEGSRALSDFLHQLEQGGYPGTVLYVPCATQGEKVVSSVTSGIDFLERGGVDCIVITRGGGSAADLRWFDSPEIAYKIARCSVPIIAAIGHHDDYCVAEEICFQKQKTPTAAADFVVHIFAQIRGFLETCLEHFRHHLSRNLMRRIEGLGRISRNLQGLALNSLGRREEKILRQSLALKHKASSQIAAHELKLGVFEKNMAAKDPKPWLKLGWTRLVFEAESDLNLERVGQGVDGVFAVKIGDALEARMWDGRLKLKVEKIETL